MSEKLVGLVTRYFDRIHVAVIELSAPIKLGDELIFRKGDTEVMQTVESIQIENTALEKAKAKDTIGMEVVSEVKPGAKVYLK